MADVYELIRRVTGIEKQLPKKSIRPKDWLSWYRGNVWGFHNYRIYNGTTHLDLERKSLQMPKFICETWANLLMNERCDIIIPDNEKEKLDNVLQEANFWLKANQAVEQSFALGIGALTVNVNHLAVGERTGQLNKSKAKVKIDFINETKIYPITIEDKEIQECAFVSVNSDSTHIVLHVRDKNGNYIIHNYVLDEKDEIVKNYVFATKSDMKWFFILRPNISSNFITDITDEELGVSIFANRIDTLKAIDNKYDAFDWEYTLGRKRTFVSSDAWRVDKENGQRIKVFDPFDSLFYQLPENDDGKPIISHHDGDLRFQAFIEGINAELDYLSSGVGFGENYLKFDGGSIATATQVVSENSTLFRNIKKHEILLEDVLIRLTKSVIFVNNTFTSNPRINVSDDEINIKFDDSIIEDRNAEMERDRLDVQAGIMAKWEYRMKWYAEDEDTAKRTMVELFNDDLINRYQEALLAGTMTPEQFVDIVYPYASNKDEIIEYILEFVKAPSGMLDMSPLYEGDETGALQEEETSEEVVDEEEENEENTPAD